VDELVAHGCEGVGDVAGGRGCLGVECSELIRDDLSERGSKKEGSVYVVSGSWGTATQEG
jgi:hypothetical protein